MGGYVPWEVIFNERLSSFIFSISFGLLSSTYVSNLRKIGSVVAEIFQVLIFDVFFHLRSSSMKGCLHLKLP